MCVRRCWDDRGKTISTFELSINLFYTIYGIPRKALLRILNVGDNNTYLVLQFLVSSGSHSVWTSVREPLYPQSKFKWKFNSEIKYDWHSQRNKLHVICPANGAYIFCISLSVIYSCPLNKPSSYGLIEQHNVRASGPNFIWPANSAHGPFCLANLEFPACHIYR